MQKPKEVFKVHVRKYRKISLVPFLLPENVPMVAGPWGIKEEGHSPSATEASGLGGWCKSAHCSDASHSHRLSENCTDLCQPWLWPLAVLDWRVLGQNWEWCLQQLPLFYKLTFFSVSPFWTLELSLSTWAELSWKWLFNGNIWCMNGRLIPHFPFSKCSLHTLKFDLFFPSPTREKNMDHYSIEQTVLFSYLTCAGVTSKPWLQSFPHNWKFSAVKSWFLIKM